MEIKQYKPKTPSIKIVPKAHIAAKRAKYISNRPEQINRSNQVPITLPTKNNIKAKN